MSEIISGERRLPYDVLEEHVAAVASRLSERGVRAGEAVVLLLRNDLAFFEAALGAIRIGAYATPVNWHASSEELAFILQDSAAKVLIAHVDLFNAVADDLPSHVEVVLVETPPELAAAYRVAEADRFPRAGHQTWREWLSAGAAQATPVSAQTTAMIYTSGTTGRPKGVRRTPPTAEQTLVQIQNAIRNFGLGELGTVVLMNGPMYHTAPNGYGMMAARFGHTIVLEPRFDAEEMLQLIERHRVTHMHVVPTMFVRLLRLPAAVRERYDLSSLRFVVHGAAPCPVEVKQQMIAWWGPVINEYYGSTETGIVAWHDAEQALSRPGTVGQVCPGAVVKAFDEDGRPLGPGEVGDLYMRSAGMTDFTYHGRDDERAAVGREDLICVGDIGWVDADGYVFLCDRRKDMIISGGVNIYPAEIEAVLIGLEGVRDCAVFGIPDSEFGEAVCAHIEVEPLGAPSLDVVRSHLAARLAKFKVPKVIEFAHALPREDSGKIFKKRLREPYWEGLGRKI
uniref:AMP-dependent synthetase and ligase n=1 Tax=Caulobacter sp. (strain K31) TaxID=366602 RepID=B0T5K2_CAUSK